MRGRKRKRKWNIWDGICCFFLFLKRLPGFYRLNRFWDKDPRFYWDVIVNYSKVMYTLTEGRLQNPKWKADFVIEEVYEVMDKRYREED